MTEKRTVFELHSSVSLPALPYPFHAREVKKKGSVCKDVDYSQVVKEVQDDIRQLRERINHGDGGSINIKDLESALAKTEEGLQMKTEQVINHYNNQVQTLPTALSTRFDPGMVAMEQTWDLRNKTKTEMKRTHDQQYLAREKLRQPQPPGALLPKRQQVQVAGPSPGQQTKHMLTLRAVLNPMHGQNRQSLNDNFGIQLPLIPQRNENKNIPRPMIGTTVEPLAVLPRANRADPQIAPPPISEDDARKGILSLLERGLIPPAAELTLDPSPVRHKTAPLHDPHVKNKPTQPEMSHHLAGVKLDIKPTKKAEIDDNVTRIPIVPPHPLSAHSTETRTPSAKTRATSASMPLIKTPATLKTFDLPLQPMELIQSPDLNKIVHIPGQSSSTVRPADITYLPHIKPPPTTPASGDIKHLTHRFAIQNGKIRDTSAEFLTFKQHYCLTWGSIVSMIRHLERMMQEFTIPIAFINGDKLADLSLEFELEKAPSVDDLLTVIVNREDVEVIMNRPGRRFKGPNGKNVAATRIQSSWRMFRDRSEYLEYRKKKWAAGVIAISWIMTIKMSQVKQKLKQSREDQLEAFRRRAKKFAMSWDRIKQSKRVIIHMSSLGLSQNIRDTIHEFGIRQNTQMARLCDIRDPNVDVIFISPVPLSEETLQYYSKLLGLKAAVDSGNVEDQCVMSERYRIITPDAIKSFPTHRMCLSTLLKYSPRTIKRIKHLIKGREAYMVSGVPHSDDLAVADELDVPILSPEPEVAHLYSTKSGCKRIFASAAVDLPPSEYDVYSLGQLHECLAQLVTENLTVKRWLFKLDDEFDGRGIAYCDVTEHLQCYPWALKESRRYGEKWSKKWAQEAAYIKIHAEIADVLHANSKPVHTSIYATWETFLEAFLSQGGVIEACPPSESITTLTVDMMIEPNGKHRMVCCGDQIHAETPFSCWGVSVPQSSVEPDVLNVACKQIAEACKTRGILGYFSVDFVTFIDPKTMEQRLWALDLSLHYSDSLAMFQLMSYVSNGVLDPAKHVLNVPMNKQEKRQRRRRLAGQEEETEPNTGRFGVMSTRLLHTNLAVVHYSVFFQMCRAHGIGYDIKEKQGTVFTLIDSFNRERLGMLTIGDNLQGALATFARNMSVIHQEISAPNMQGETNFKSAIEDVEGILGTTIENADEPDHEETNDQS
ncbi:IQ domain-containing protein H-like isoform X2 [Mizuhopecten yessoensis]|uniref:IQ domain-containing protein H-like isoform X2 n=1 Tax=Mizuhopecten yessoensis TaxID=6573 RepID=UPI000B458C02|nr:IQ domain-containing protein H-like isoform X2 [Mizuhopecten yessoensis]